MKQLLSFIFLSVALHASATVWHISPSGNDATGNGTIAFPWRTLYKATQSVTTAGDWIHVYPGSYVETQQSILARGVNIQGTDTTAVITSTLSATFTAIIEAVSVEGTDGSHIIQYLKFDGGRTTSWAINFAGRSNITVSDCVFRNFNETAVNFSGLQVATSAGRPGTRATNNKFLRNILYNNASNTVLYGAKYGKGNLQFGGQDGFECAYNTIIQPQRDSANNEDIGWPIKMANEGYNINFDIHHNTLKRAPIAAANGLNENWDFSIEFWNVEGGCKIHDNTLQGEVDIVRCVKGSSTYSLWMYNNYSSQPTLRSNASVGVRLEKDVEYSIVEGNTFENLATAQAFSPHDYHNAGQAVGEGTNVHYNVFQKNLCKNMGTSTGGGFAVIWPQGCDFEPHIRFTDYSVLNNTMIAAPGSQASYWGIYLPSYTDTIGSGNSNIKVINNHIEGFASAGDTYGGAMLAQFGSRITSLYVQNNNMISNSSSNVAYISGGTPVSYTNTGNMSVSPGFTGNYIPGSNLIDHGTPVGLTYYGSAPDIGWYETGASPPGAQTILSIKALIRVH